MRKNKMSFLLWQIVSNGVWGSWREINRYERGCHGWGTFARFLYLVWTTSSFWVIETEALVERLYHRNNHVSHSNWALHWAHRHGELKDTSLWSFPSKVASIQRCRVGSIRLCLRASKFKSLLICNKLRCGQSLSLCITNSRRVSAAVAGMVLCCRRKTNIFYISYTRTTRLDSLINWISLRGGNFSDANDATLWVQSSFNVWNDESFSLRQLWGYHDDARVLKFSDYIQQCSFVRCLMWSHQIAQKNEKHVQVHRQTTSESWWLFLAPVDYQTSFESL